MKPPRPPFGLKNAPPEILHAPKGLPGGPAGPTKARKASLSVGLITFGAFVVAGGGVFEAARRQQAVRDEACRAAPSSPDRPKDCDQHGSGGGHGGSGSSHWFGYYGGSSSSSSGHATSTGTPSGGHGSFGGFGATGASHSGGGHGAGA